MEIFLFTIEMVDGKKRIEKNNNKFLTNKHLNTKLI